MSFLVIEADKNCQIFKRCEQHDEQICLIHICKTLHPTMREYFQEYLGDLPKLSIEWISLNNFKKLK